MSVVLCLYAGPLLPPVGIRHILPHAVTQTYTYTGKEHVIVEALVIYERRG